MFYAAFSFYPFVSIRVIRGQKNLRKPQRFSPVAAWGMPIFTQRVTFGNAGRTDASPAKVRTQDGFVRRRNGFAVVNLEFAGGPAGNAVLRRNRNVTARPR